MASSVSPQTATVSTNYLRLLAETLKNSIDTGQSSSAQWTESIRKEHQQVMDMIASLEGRDKTEEIMPGSSQHGLVSFTQDSQLQTPATGQSEVAQSVNEGSSDDIVNVLKSAEEAKADLDDSLGFDPMTLYTILDHLYGHEVCHYYACIKVRAYGAQPVLDELKLHTSFSHFTTTATNTLLYLTPHVNLEANTFNQSTFISGDIQFDNRFPVTYGAFGDIYKGQFRGRAVCLKIPRKMAASDRPMRWTNNEIKIWSSLSHVNVLPFYGIMQLEDSRIALVSPWMQHGNIIEYLKNKPDVDRWRMTSDVAAGLSYLHSRSIIHGDIKGENILVTASNRACLADFGLSFFANNVSMMSSLQRNGPARWMAPELMDFGESEAPKTEASDVYAFSMAVLEIFTGNKPFQEIPSDASVVLAVARGGRPIRPSSVIAQDRGLTDNIWHLLEACWAQKPSDRLSASGISEELTKITNDRPDMGFKGHLQSLLFHHRLESPGHQSRMNNTIQIIEEIIDQLIHDENQNHAHAYDVPASMETIPHVLGDGAASIQEIPSRQQSLDVFVDEEADKDSISIANQKSEAPQSESMVKPKDRLWFQEITEKLSTIFGDVEQYRQILNCPRSPNQIQELLNLFQALLDDPRLENKLRHNLVVAMQRLCKSTNMYPKCFSLGEGDLVVLGDCPVAAGGFADIHQAKFCGKIVCFKVIRLYQKSRVEYALKRFYQEAILWGQLSHPNLLPFYGLYHFQSRLCLVSPWAENGDITAFLKKKPCSIRILLALDIALGLEYLHENDIIHGDVKGANVLVSDPGRAVLADFGLSSVTDTQILEWTSHSSAASKGGSIRWQAPELYGEDEDEVMFNSKRSDVYAWACVSYEVFTGEVPFYEYRRDATVMLNVGRGKRPSRPPSESASWAHWGLTETLWSLMESCWSVVPEERPTAADVVATLAQHAPPDARPVQQWDELSPLNFKEGLSDDPDRLSINMDTMLWGTNSTV